MDKQDLITYLEEEKAERQAKTNDYVVACEQLEAARCAYEDAQKIVDSFGSIDSINAEIEKINGFITLLTAEEKTEDTSVGTEGSVLTTTLCTAVE